MKKINQISKITNWMIIVKIMEVYNKIAKKNKIQKTCLIISQE